MDKLLRGLDDFLRRKRPGLRGTFKRLAKGQNPVALVLACSDSRVVPSLLLGADPGDIFEVRTLGNIIAPAGAGGGASVGDESEAAAIEYALLSSRCSSDQGPRLQTRCHRSSRGFSGSVPTVTPELVK